MVTNYITYFTCLTLYIFFVTSTETKSNETDLFDTISKVASIASKPEIIAAVELLKTFKQESSLTIGDRKDQMGFWDIQNDYDYVHGSVLIEDMDNLISFWLDDDTYCFLNNHQKNIISRAIKEYTMQIMTDSFYKQKYELSFSDGKGSIFMMILSITPHPVRNNAVKWTKYVLKVDFVPAPSYVIATESSCNLFSCDRTDSIVYLPTVLNGAHIREIVTMNIDMLMGFGGWIEDKVNVIN